jgi:hypothetical protein
MVNTTTTNYDTKAGKENYKYSFDNTACPPCAQSTTTGLGIRLGLEMRGYAENHLMTSMCESYEGKYYNFAAST